MKNLRTHYGYTALVTLLCLVSLNIQAQIEGDGYGANSGGNAGPSVTVTNESQLRQYAESNSAYNITVSGTINLGTNGSISLGSNTTLQGANTSSTILGTIFINGVSNVIVKYLNISANTGSPGSNDGINVRGGASNILITKCSIYDCADGNIDITHGGGNTTVSWCKFYYTRDNGHNFSNLIGASDSDYGDYRTTWHHNWWAQGAQQRMTATRFGPCHMYNNYWNCSGNDYCTTSRNVGEVRSENNYYDNVEDPLAKEQSGILYTSGNIFNNCTGSQMVSSDNVFYPPYSYALNSTGSVPSIVMNGAGNTGNSDSGGGNVYQLRNRGTGLYLDGVGRTTNGDACAQWANTTHPNSQWQFVDVGSGYTQLRNVGTGLYLDGMGRTANGDDVAQWINTTHPNSHWSVQQFDGNYYRLQNRSTGLYLDGMGRTGNGNACGQWGNTTHPNAQWQLISVSGARLNSGATSEDLEPRSILFYPNPVGNTLNIRLEDDEKTMAKIFNLSGQLMMSADLVKINNEVDVRKLSQGVYFLEIATRSGIRHTKLIKE